jgi:hypothetical protein
VPVDPVTAPETWFLETGLHVPKIGNPPRGCQGILFLVEVAQLVPSRHIVKFSVAADINEKEDSKDEKSTTEAIKKMTKAVMAVIVGFPKS